MRRAAVENIDTAGAGADSLEALTACPLQKFGNALEVSALLIFTLC
jgi:hypothetical protein